MPEHARRKCFVAGPIGAQKSPERAKANWLLKGIIKPVLENPPFEFEVQRADEFTTPGLITAQIINAVIECDLVVADLTGWNPNAFYELALAHTEEKRVIHMIEEGNEPPFDIKDYRAIFYEVTEFDQVEKAKTELASQAAAVLSPDFHVSNPITSARGRIQLARSGDPRGNYPVDVPYLI